jgi:hypothetical protein
MARQLDILADGTPVDTGTTQSIARPEKLQYSDAEVFTGEYWIDGKPIYRRTFTVTGPSAAGTNIAPIIGAGYDTVVRYEAICDRPSGPTTGPTYYGTTGVLRWDVSLDVVMPATQLKCDIVLDASATDYASYPFIITAYYTKTTD